MGAGANQQISLTFTADASKAKKEISSMEKSLNSLFNSLNKIAPSGLSKELAEATVKAGELRGMIQAATNVDTGKLDLSQLNKSLKKSKTTLHDYAKIYRQLGPQGEKAFTQIAQSISSAEVPLKRTSKLLDEFKTTLKNTARWELSSKIMHGLERGLEQAYHYAKDLNKSLNDIRIVTGFSSDQMKDFAIEANKAARALSTSTTAYTNASLIYYQQGLDAASVKERTDITVKMANVTGQTAEETSNQLTAIWNNFAKGSEELEHYADVMTALGAATASSSEEIATGLQKFSAIADTVGLSYEYAAAALATVTAETRQSADVVGTAFKTLFARMEGLKLGETLEDGTNLNKYSEALAKVGVAIKDSSGNMRDMDSILDDLGSRWQTLTKDEKLATAQTVAGVRQYNQLLALMDNWGTFKENLITAQTSDGSLQDQADIYAESWEAAEKRARASLERIYDQLLNDDFFIKLTNVFSFLTDGIGNVIDALGGLKGVLPLIGALLLKTFNKDISESFARFKENRHMRSEAGQNEIANLRKEATSSVADSFNQNSTGGKVKVDLVEKQTKFQDLIIANQKNLLAQGKELTEEDEKQLELIIKTNDALTEQAKLRADALDASQDANFNAKHSLNVMSKSLFSGKEDRKAANDLINSFKNDKEDKNALYSDLPKAPKDGSSKNFKAENEVGSMVNTVATRLSDQKQAASYLEASLKSLDNTMKTEGKTAKDYKDEIQSISNEFRKMAKSGKMPQSEIDAITKELGELSKTGGASIKELLDNDSVLTMFGNLDTRFTSFQQKLQDAGFDAEKLDAILKQLGDSADATGVDFVWLEGAIKSADNYRKEAENGINNLGNTDFNMADGLVAMGEAIGAIAGTISMITGLFETWQGVMDGTTSVGEALITTITTVTTVVGILTQVLSKQNVQLIAGAVETVASALGMKTLAAAEGEAAVGATSFGTALWTALWPIGLVMAALAALALIIAKVAQTMREADPGYQLEKASEAAQRANETFEEIKTTTEELNGALHDLENGYDVLDGMATHTEAWSQQLEKVNNQVLDLMTRMPEISQYVHTDENGVMRIDEAGIELMKKQNQERQMAAYGQKMFANAALLDAKANAIEYDTGSIQSPNVLSEMQEIYNGSGDYRFGVLNGTEEYTAENSENPTTMNQDMLDKGTVVYVNNGDNASSYYSKETGATIEDTQAVLDANAQQFEEKYQLMQQKAEIMKAWFSTQVQATGSVRDIDSAANIAYEGLDDTEKQSGSNALEVAFKAGEKASNEFEWHDHVNYNEDDPEWAQIQNFIKAQGSQYEYVAQRNGKMVVKDTETGDEKEFEKSDMKQFTQADATSKSFINNYMEGLQKQLKEDAKIDQSLMMSSSGEKDADGNEITTINQEAVTKLDNLRYAITEGIRIDLPEGATSEEREQAEKDAIETGNAGLKALTEAYTVEGETGEDTMARIDEATEHIDFADAEIQRRLAANFNISGQNVKATGDQIKDTIAELNAEGELETMSETFSEAANNMGMKESDAKAMQDYASVLMDVSKESDLLSDDLAKDADAAADLAIEVTRMNKGVATLEKNFKGWNDVLKNSSKESAEYAEALIGMKNAVADILDVSADLIDADFIEANTDLIEKASKGEGDAIDELRSKMDEQVVKKVSLGLDKEAAADLQKESDSILGGLQNQLKDLEVGAVFKDEEALKGLNDFVQKNKMSADEANAYLAGIGYEPVYNQEEVDSGQEAPNSETSVALTGFAMEKKTVNILGHEDEMSVPTFKITTSTKPAKPTKADGAMRLTSFSGKGRAPEIKGVRKRAKGSMNNNSSSNPGSVGSGNKGGGGSKSSPAKPKKLTKKNEIVERYKEITDAIQDVGKELEHTSLAADKLYGPARLKAMRDANELSKKEVKLLQQKRKEAIAYEKADRDALNEAAAAAGVTLDYNENGNVTNYTEVLNQLYEQLHAVEAKANTYTDSEAQSEYYEKNVTPLKEKIEELKAQLAQYDETKDLIEDIDLEIEQKQYEQLEKELEILEYPITIQIEADDSSLKYLDYLLGKIEDDAFSAAERIALLTNQMGYVTDKVEATRKGLSDILATQLSDEDMEKFNNGQIDEIDFSQYTITDKLKQDIANYKDQLMELNEQLMEIAKTVHEQVGRTFEEWNEKIDNQLAKFDAYTSLIDSLKSINDIMGINQDDDLNIALQEDKLTIAQDNVAANKAANDAAQAHLAKIKATMAGMTEEQKKLWEDDLAAAEERAAETQANLYDSLNAAVEAANEVYIAKTEAAIKKFEQTITNKSGGLDELEAQMSRQQEVAERYLNTYESVYEISKLNRQVQQSIDETDNIKGKKILLDLQKEIVEKQEKGVKLSEYDINYMQKKYELRLAQIALEEAQNAKDTVRLNRDNEGNWGYVYTANEDNVAAAQQNYEDKLYEIQTLSNDYLEETSNNIAASQRKFADALRDIDQKMRDGLYENEAAYHAAQEQARQELMEDLNYYGGEMEKAMGNNQSLYETDWSKYSGFVGGKISANEDFKRNFGETTLGITTGFSSVTDALTATRDAVGTPEDEDSLLGTINNAFVDLQADINTSMSAAGTSISTFQSDFLTLAGEVCSDSEVLRGDIEEDCGDMVDSMASVVDEVLLWEKEHKDAIDGIIAANESAIDSCLNLEHALAGDTDGMSSSDGSVSGGAEPVGTTETNGNGELTSGEVVTYTGGKYYERSDGTGEHGERGPNKPVTVTRVVENAKYPIHVRSADSAYGWLKKEQLTGYDTGGYTGSWGSEGKLALLHQKELILNSHDTENLLNAVNILRDITSEMSFNKAFEDALSSIMYQTSNLNSLSTNVNQNVTIQADFPNVSDRLEIEEAFNSLVNSAAQYAFRR